MNATITIVKSMPLIVDNSGSEEVQKTEEQYWKPHVSVYPSCVNT